MKILVTGFEAFLGESVNPSQKIAASCAQIPGVDSLLLPVAFAKAFPILQKKLETEHYQAVLLFGQAGQRVSICLERIAINWRESESPDNEGVIASPGHKIAESSPDAFFSTLPLEEMKEALALLQIPVEFSYSAGAYVCNDLFFKTAEFLKDRPTRCGFIHVPYLPEQVSQKPGAPSMEFAIMEKAAKALIACLYRQGSDI